MRTAWIYPRPRDRLHHFTAVDTAQFHMMFSVFFSRWTCDVLLQTDLFITRLRCAEPPAITFATIRSRTRSCTSSRPDKSASLARHPIGICKTAGLREPVTISRTRVRSTPRTLQFWLSVRLKVYHDVLKLSSNHHNVLDLFPSP